MFRCQTPSATAEGTSDLQNLFLQFGGRAQIGSAEWRCDQDDEPAADEVVVPTARPLRGRRARDLQLLSIEAPMEMGLCQEIFPNKWCFTCSAKMVRSSATDGQSTKLMKMRVHWYYNLDNKPNRRAAWEHTLQALEARGTIGNVKVKYRMGPMKADEIF
eukprot:g18578.t1